MAACPIISTSRGVALVSAALLVLSIIFSGCGKYPLTSNLPRSTLVLDHRFFCLIDRLGLVFWLGYARTENGTNRAKATMTAIPMYEAARPMTADYPFFGVGPGTFATVFKLYRISNSTYWPEQLHNDWLETRITFGWVGLMLLLAALMCVVFRWFAPGGIRASKWFLLLAWLGPAGCLVHALFDFPFQIYSILFLFLAICAALFSLTQKSRGSLRTKPSPSLRIFPFRLSGKQSFIGCDLNRRSNPQSERPQTRACRTTKDGRRFSLSLEERAGVRVNVL